MSFLGAQAWESQLREHTGFARELGLDIHRARSGAFRRVFLFAFPIYNRVARLDRERQLFNSAMEEHIQHEHRRNPWPRRLLLSVLFLVIGWALYAFPPEPLARSAPYKRAGQLRAKFVLAAQGWLTRVRAQAREPEKVWVNGTDGLFNLLLGVRGKGIGAGLSESERWKEELMQMQELRLRNAQSGALDLGAFDAVVLVVRGVARADGQRLAARQVLREGALVSTEPRSFVKLWLPDDSTFALGPSSSLRIGASRSGGAALVDVLSGSLRAKVTKSPEKDPAGQPREKLLIRTKSAAMGIRGTEFYVSYAPDSETSSLLTFEGLVAITRPRSPDSDPEETLAKAEGVQSVGAGMYSELARDQAATKPLPVPAAQLELLRSSSDIQGSAEAQLQEQTRSHLGFLQGAGLLLERSNGRPELYEALSEEQLLQLGGPAALVKWLPPAPAKEDYEQLDRVPASLAVDRAQFPDLPSP